MFPKKSLTMGILCLVAVSAGAQPSQTLTNVAELRALTPEQADRQLPVHIQGVVTYVERKYPMLYVQDATGGTYIGGSRNVIHAEEMDRRLRPGDRVEVSGVTNRGKFIPHIDQGEKPVRVRILGQAPLPTPLRPRPGEVFNPKLHNQWVELEAFASKVRMTRRWIRVSLVVGGEQMQALISREHEDREPPDFTNSDLRIRGVYGVTFNDQREMTGANLLVPTLDQIQVLDPGLQSAFSQPLVPLQDVRQFWPGPVERVHVEGMVTWADSRGFYLSDGDGATWVAPADGTTPEVGTTVTVVGFPSIDQGSLRIRDAVVQPSDSSLQIEPQLVERTADGLDGHLVRVEGKVMDRLHLTHSSLIVVHNGAESFQARFAEPEPRLQLPEKNAWVAVTGVLERIDPQQEPSQFRLLLRRAEDLQVLRSPPWWTIERIAFLAGGLAVVLLASVTWAVTLRRRVAAQAQVIADQIESQRLAEERSRIGRELHDTLEQYLTGVAMQIDAASALLPETAAPAKQSLQAASAMLSHSRQEARRSVWDLKSSLLEREGLPASLNELAESMQTPQTAIHLEVPRQWEKLGGKSELHLFRIAQEAVSNALKHAEASRIDIVLTQDESQTELTICDDGGGFDPANPNAERPLHFGLAGMRERAGKLNATFELESQPRQGTLVRVFLARENR